MAVKELYTSREMHITKEGTTLTQIFSCSDTDVNNWGDGITALPVLGLPWSPHREDLRITDISVRWENNKVATIEALYSTQGLSYPRNLPDKQSSLTTVFDFSYEPIQLNNQDDKYWDYVDIASATWGSKFKVKYTSWANATGYVAGYIRENDAVIYECILNHTSSAADEPGTGAEWATYWTRVVELPPVPEPDALIVMTEKMNLSGWDWNAIKESIGKVNDADWLKAYVRKLRTRRVTWIDITGDDTGHWLFTGFHCEEIGYRNYEATLTYTHNYAGWNAPYGLTLGLYQTANFNVLPYPTDIDDYVNDGLR